MVAVHRGAPAGSTRGVVLAAWAGILWPVLAIPRVFLTGEIDAPNWSAPPADIVAFYAKADFDAAFVTAMWVTTVAYVFYLVFVTRMAGLFGSLDGGSPWMGYLLVAAAAIDSALTLGYIAGFSTATFWGSRDALSADGYLVLHGLAWSCYWLDLVVQPLVLVVLAVMIVATRALPAWLGWAMAATAVAQLAAFFLPPDFWNFTGVSYLWVLIAGVALLRSGLPEEPADLAPASPEGSAL